MQHPTLHHTPAISTLLLLLLLTTILTSLLSLRPFFHLQLHPHLLPQLQLSRIPLFQTTYANSSELLFASLLLYHLRLVERAYGTRKFLSLVVYSWAVTSCVITGLLVVVGGVSQRVWSREDGGGGWNYIPPGPTPILFSLLACYAYTIPSVYKFSLALPSAAPQSPMDMPPEITLSDKSFTYLLSAQLALSQLPGSAVCAGVGWIVGYLWREEVLPGHRWRVGGRVVELVGGDDGEARREVERIRERLAGEGGAGGVGQGVEGSRSIVNRVLDTFRGN